MHSQSKRRAKIISDECVLCCQCSAHRTKCERKVDGENAREKKPSKTKLERLKGVDDVSGVDGVRYTRYSQANNVDKSLRNRVDVKCHAKLIASSTKRRKKNMRKNNGKIELGLPTKWAEKNVDWISRLFSVWNDASGGEGTRVPPAAHFTRFSFETQTQQMNDDKTIIYGVSIGVAAWPPLLHTLKWNLLFCSHR